MKTKIAIVALTLVAIFTMSNKAFAQSDSLNADKVEVKVAKTNFDDETSHPEFPGGTQAFFNFISENLRYPDAAKENNSQGKVYVKFLVLKDGSTDNFEVLKGIGNGCDEEALRILKSMPRWKPAERKGEPVDMWFTTPINFNQN